MKEQIGLIGVGIMGAPIARALIDHGYEVIAYDKSAAAMSRARDIGCAAAATPAAVAGRTDVILISLPRPEHVTEVVRSGDVSLLTGARPGSVIVDTSTVDPATSQQNARAGAERGIGYLDCPILGRPAGCGNWTLPAGGEPEHLRTVMPVLEVFASRVVHVGPSGHGNTLKLLNQLMFGAINSVTAEMFAAAVTVGMDPSLLFDTIVNSGAGTVSNLFKELGPKVVADEFTPNFTVNNLHKDVGLGLAMAEAAGIALEFSEAGQRLTETAQAASLGDQDTAAVFKALVNKGAEK